MISVASLLNPTDSEIRGTYASSSPSSIHSIPLSSYGSLLPSQVVTQKQKMAKDNTIFTPGKTRGEVNFPPFEDLDESDILEVKKYHIHPLGSIKDCPRHIPYNSDKKSFLEKTGRESFEVFQYEFKLMREDKTYTVMWDYNIGLVRITPFFKCCKYSKTTPAKMLNLNPGLKDITHSITGGALVAQGYWMPYSCALAVCATFCAHISGALIPIFGPEFPSQCTPTSHQSYGIMVIEPSIIASATSEAELFRQLHATASPSSSVAKLPSTSPRESLCDNDHLSHHNPAGFKHRLKLKRTFANADIYTTDAENSDTSTSSRDYQPCSPLTPATSYNSHGWTPDNVCPTISPKHHDSSTHLALSRCDNQSSESFICDSAPLFDQDMDQFYNNRPAISYGASPWLSAIPRSVAYSAVSFSTPSIDIATPISAKTPPGTLRRSTRQTLKTMDIQRVHNTESEKEYYGEDDGEEESPTSGEQSRQSGQSEGSEGLEKKAAWLLMNLSVQDGAWTAGTDMASTAPPDAHSNTQNVMLGSNSRIVGKDVGHSPTVENLCDPAPRAKRLRATTL